MLGRGSGTSLHPRVVGADQGPPDCPQNNIGLVLHGVMEYDLSLRFLENALAVSTKYHATILPWAAAPTSGHLWAFASAVCPLDLLTFSRHAAFKTQARHQDCHEILRVLCLPP